MPGVCPTLRQTEGEGKILDLEDPVRSSNPGAVRDESGAARAWRGRGSTRPIDLGAARKPGRAGHAIMNSIVSSVERAALPSDPHMGLTALSIHNGLQGGRRIEAAPCDTERTT